MLSGSAIGDAGISYDPNGGTPKPAQAQVEFKITIPRLMILRVGDWGGQVNTVEWNYAFGNLGTEALDGKIGGARASEDQWKLANTSGTAGAMIANKEDEKPADGILDVAAFGNVGQDLTLFPTSKDFNVAVADTAQPHLSEITAGGSKIPHPKLADNDVGEKVSLKHTKGIVSLQDKWQYTYTPGSTPVGGVYTATVVYTLAAL